LTRIVVVVVVDPNRPSSNSKGPWACS